MAQGGSIPPAAYKNQGSRMGLAHLGCAPGEVTQAQLDELSIAVTRKEEES